MSYTKRQFINQAFSQIGLAHYQFDLSPEQLEAALQQLDSMMAVWNAKGIKLGYPIPASPQNSDIDQETGVPDVANEAISLNLALRIAPTFGKALQQSTAAIAKMSYDNLLSLAAMPPQQQMPGTMPSGAGNKPWRTFDDAFLRPPSDDPLGVDAGNGQLEFLGD